MNKRKVYTLFLDTGTDTWLWMKDANDEAIYIGEAVGVYRHWFGKHKISNQLEHDATTWLLEFEKANLYNMENAQNFNWTNFHTRGLALAKRLKRELGDEADVRYIKASEDPSYNRKEMFEVTKESTVLATRKLSARID